MAITFEDLICSRPFQFIVGPGRKSFTVHAALIADQSAPLSRLINGSMCEAKDGTAILDDIDEQTFAKFCEYSYTGDYTPPLKKVSLKNDKTSPLLRMKDIEHFRGWGKKVKSKQRDSIYDYPVRAAHEYCAYEIKQAFWDEFQNRDYSVVDHKFLPRENLEECKDHISLCLCHARVYVIADKYDIVQLRSLTLDKLHQALLSFKAAEYQIGSIVDLIRFSYSNDNTRDTEAGQDIDSLRKMVVQFVACVFEKVVADEDFLVLLEEGGPLARDLAGLLAKRILS